jgi:Tfp pilus assembly protein PilX
MRPVAHSEQGRPRHGSKAEEGQTLVLALLALALGVVLIAGFLYYVSTSQRATEAIREEMIDQYSADAGAEDAIWKLANQPAFRDSLVSGTPYVYTISINGRTVTIMVTKVISP